MKTLALGLLLAVSSLGIAAPTLADPIEDGLPFLLQNLAEIPGALPALQAKLAETKESIHAVYTASNFEEGQYDRLSEYHYLLVYPTFTFELWRSYLSSTEGEIKIVREEFALLTPEQTRAAKRWMTYVGFPLFETLDVLLANPAAIADFFGRFPAGRPGWLFLSSDFRDTDEGMQEVFAYESNRPATERSGARVRLEITQSGEWGTHTYTYAVSETPYQLPPPTVDPKPRTSSTPVAAATGAH